MLQHFFYYYYYYYQQCFRLHFLKKYLFTTLITTEKLEETQECQVRGELHAFPLSQITSG